MLQTIRDEFIRLVNQERQRVGVPALTAESRLHAAAAIRSVEIRTSFSHTRPDGRSCFTAIEEAGYHSWASGENISMTGMNAGGYISSSDVFTGDSGQLRTIAANAFNQFKNSPGHYSNMISGDFTETGVGVSWQIYEDWGVPVFYFAHFFGRPMH